MRITAATYSSLALLFLTVTGCSNDGNGSGGNAVARVEFAQRGESARLERPKTFIERVHDWFVPSAHAQEGGGGGALGAGGSASGGSSTASGGSGPGASSCPLGWTCHDPIELSLKMDAIYVAYDIDASGRNIGPTDGSQPDTQAVYASPNCPAVDAEAETQPQPNLGNCGIDVGLDSSSNPPQEIVASPDFIDLAAGTESVNAELAAGSFQVKAGTYKYLRLGVGSNAPRAQGNGTQDSLPEGTAMNFRFRAPGMDEAFEVRRLVGINIAFPEPLEITAGQTVTLTLSYDTSGAVVEIPDGNSATFNEDTCTPSRDGKRYCLDASRVVLVPSISVD